MYYYAIMVLLIVIAVMIRDGVLGPGGGHFNSYKSLT